MISIIDPNNRDYDFCHNRTALVVYILAVVASVGLASVIWFSCMVSFSLRAFSLPLSRSRFMEIGLAIINERYDSILGEIRMLISLHSMETHLHKKPAQIHHNSKTSKDDEMDNTHGVFLQAQQVFCLEGI